MCSVAVSVPSESWREIDIDMECETENSSPGRAFGVLSHTASTLLGETQGVGSLMPRAWQAKVIVVGCWWMAGAEPSQEELAPGESGHNACKQRQTKDSVV
jgi:hypothetical protein